MNPCVMQLNGRSISAGNKLPQSDADIAPLPSFRLLLNSRKQRRNILAAGMSFSIQKRIRLF